MSSDKQLYVQKSEVEALLKRTLGTIPPFSLSMGENVVPVVMVPGDGLKVMTWRRNLEVGETKTLRVLDAGNKPLPFRIYSAKASFGAAIATNVNSLTVGSGDDDDLGSGVAFQATGTVDVAPVDYKGQVCSLLVVNCSGVADDQCTVSMVLGIPPEAVNIDWADLGP